MNKLIVDKLSMRRFSSKDIPRLMSLLTVEPFKKYLFSWQFYREYPDSVEASENPYLVAFYNQDTLVAFNGVMPVKAWVDGEDRTIYWSCDLVVDEDFRGKGVGKKLKEELKNKCSNYILSLGISDRAVRLLECMGWASGKSVEEYKKEKLAFNVKSVIKVLVQNYNKLCGVFKESHYDGSLKVTLSQFLPGSNEIDQLWSRSKDSYTKAVVRDSAYLKWRYESHPLSSGDYQYICLNSKDSLEGMIVVRYADGCLNVVDYLGPLVPENFQALLSFAIDNFSDAKSYRVVTSSKLFKKVLLQLGFFKTRFEQRFAAYNALEKEPESGWFIMAGDSDGELLQAARASYVQSKRESNGR